MALKTARIAALETLYKVEVKGYKADETLSRSYKYLKDNRREKALARELCYGVLRRRLRLDYVLHQFYGGDLGKLSPWIRNILRLGAYQLLFLDRVPPWAALNECVKLAHRYGHKGTAGLVNGILRSICREKDSITYPSLQENALQHISVVYSYPTWLIKRWLDKYGVEKTVSLCKANNEAPRLTVRANTLRTTPQRLAGELRREGLRVEPCNYSDIGLKLQGCGAPSELEAFQRGLFQVQDEASMLSVGLLDPAHGMKVLDCCAGLGGKATAAAEIMGDSGLIVALDINYRRLAMLKENRDRLGIHTIRPVLMDSSVQLSLNGLFDAVMVDAPCSNLGVLHRHPEIRWKRREEDLLRFQALQLRILSSARRYVKPGGIMVYSTCTVEPEENQEVIKRFLSEHEGFMVEDAGSILPPRARRFLTPEGFLHTFPDSEGMDGFFAARIKYCGRTS